MRLYRFSNALSFFQSFSERDAKAFYESSEAKKIEFEKLIAKLRTENKLMRVTLAKSINVGTFNIK